MEIKNKKIMVTGGAGFIGSHLVERLVKEGVFVIVIDDLSKAYSKPFPDEIKLIKMKLPNPEFSEILKNEKPSAIFHLAGTSYVPPSVKYPLKDLQSNTQVTLSILESIRQTAPHIPIVYFSSAAVYGNPKKLPISEDNPVDPISPYGVSKLAAERYVFIYTQIHKIHAASLRLFSVYGPYQKKQVIFDLIDKLHKEPNKLFIYGDGSETRDFIYVEDVVRAALLVMEKGKLEGEVYNVASENPISIKELAETIVQVMNLKPNIIFSGHVRPGDPLRWESDISKLKGIGFKPDISIEEGIKRILSWYYDIHCLKEK